MILVPTYTLKAGSLCTFNTMCHIRNQHAFELQLKVNCASFVGKMSSRDSFVISLACADLLASTFAFVQPKNSFIWHRWWQLGSALCKALLTIAPISLVASSSSLVLIADDRFR